MTKEDQERLAELMYGEHLCPVCGEKVKAIGETTDGRIIGSCKDAFDYQKWVDDE